MKPDDCVGWTLNDARAAWQTQFPDIAIEVRETAPPARPAPREVARKAKRGVKPQAREKPRETWGEWRVLRCNWQEADSRHRLKIVAAREIVLEETALQTDADANESVQIA